MLRLLLPLALILGSSACDGSVAPARTAPGLGSLLADGPEQLEFASTEERQELFDALVRLSQEEDGVRAEATPVLFALDTRAGLFGAPGLPSRVDLLASADAGIGASLIFEEGSRRWPDDAREALQGLSEREAAGLVARTLMSHWGLQPESGVLVERAPGAPYAAAWLDGILRINPVLLYLATAPGAANGAPPAP